MTKRRTFLVPTICALLISGLLSLSFYQQFAKPFGDVFWLKLYGAVFTASAGLIWSGYGLWKSFHRVTATLLLLVGGLAPSLLVSLKLDYRTLLFPQSKAQLSAVMWQDDIRQMAETIKQDYPGFYDRFSDEEFDAKVKELIVGAENWSDQTIKVKIMELVSSLEDGHSIVPPQPSINFNVLPLYSQNFDDGVYIIDAANDYQHLVNHKITHIGDVAVEQVFSLLEPYIGAENQGQEWDRFALYSGMTELLYEIGISKDSDKTKLTLEKDGNSSDVVIEGKPYYQWALFYLTRSQQRTALPYEFNMRKEFYWTEFDEQSKILYVNINDLQDSETMSVAGFARHLNAQINQHDFEKIVVDLRQNRGGSNFKARAILNTLRDSEKANQPGKLFVLISPRTFSAAVNLASMLENQTHGIFVGEPTGQGANQYGDGTGYTLRHSGIWFSLSSVEWRGRFKQDRENAIHPHYTVTYSFSDYLNQRDPAIELVKQYSRQEREQAKEVPSQRYLTDEGAVVEFVKDDRDNWNFVVDDFAKFSVNRIQSPVYVADGKLKTHLRGIELVVDRDQFEIWVNNQQVTMRPLSKEFKAPFQLFYSGELEAMTLGAELLKQAPEYNYLYPGIEYKIRQYGYEFYNAKEFAKAIVVFEFISHLKPKYTYSWSRLGMAYFKTGDMSQAVQCFEKALELNPQNLTAKDMMYRLQQEIGS